MKRAFRSKTYNHTFDMKTGEFAYWGETLDKNPAFCPFGPTILDIEISAGKCKGNCKFCYKSNGLHNTEIINMGLDTFKEILARMDLRVLTQIAFGLCDVSTNPDMWDIFEYCRSKNIIPNYTCNGLDVTDEVVEKTARLCGAVAVSLVNKEKSYDTIYKFTSAGMTQVNIHFMLAEETYEKAFEILDDIKTDPRLAKMNAIVFLQYKPKGKGVGFFHPISRQEKYSKLVEYATENKIRLGFDSCSAPLYLKHIENDKAFTEKSSVVEACESCLHSGYINCQGIFFPCSFSEEVPGWETGINVLAEKTFTENVWYHPRVISWRENLLASSSNCDCKCKEECRSCPVYPEVTSCKGG